MVKHILPKWYPWQPKSYDMLQMVMIELKLTKLQSKVVIFWNIISNFTLFYLNTPVHSCKTANTNKLLSTCSYFKADLNVFKHWIQDTLDWGHHNLWSRDFNHIHGYPNCTGSNIIWMLVNRDHISAPATNVGLPPSMLWNWPDWIQTHDQN